MTTLPKLSIVFALLALANTHVYAAAEADTEEALNTETTKPAKDDAEPTKKDNTVADADTDETTKTETPDGDTSAIEGDAEDPDTSTETKATETKATETKPAPTVKKKKGKHHRRAHRAPIAKASDAAKQAMSHQTSLHQDMHCSPCQTTAEAPVVQTIDVAEGPCDDACTVA